MMTSSDNEILVRIYEGQVQIIQRLDKLESRVESVETEQKTQREELQAQRQDIQSLTKAMIQFDKTQAVTSSRLEDLQTSVYWGVALLGLFIAFVSWVRPKDTPAPQIDNKPSRYELEGMIRDVVKDMLPELRN